MSDQSAGTHSDSTLAVHLISWAVAHPGLPSSRQKEPCVGHINTPRYLPFRQDSPHSLLRPLFGLVPLVSPHVIWRSGISTTPPGSLHPPSSLVMIITDFVHPSAHSLCLLPAGDNPRQIAPRDLALSDPFFFLGFFFLNTARACVRRSPAQGSAALVDCLKDALHVWSKTVFS